MVASLKEGLESRAFWLLVIAHSPNRYIATILLCIIAILQFSKSKSLNCSLSFLAPILGFAASQLVGLGSGIIHFSSCNNIFWSFFNDSIFVVAMVLCVALSREEINSGLKIFVILEALVLSAQYSVLILKFKTVFVFSAFSGAGDALSGTLLGFSSPLAVSLMMISLYFLFSYFDRKRDSANLLFSAISAFFSTFPGMMSAVAVFILAICVAIISFSLKEFVEMKMSRVSVIIVPVVIFSLGVLVYFLGDNVKYMGNIFSLMLQFDNPPIKILVVQKYIELIGSGGYLLLGCGLGNFTSRAAAMVSGQYFEIQPFFVPVTPSLEMLRYILPFWNHGMFGEIVGGSIGNSMINEPFNGHLSILAECGVLGFGLWVLGLAYSIVRSFLMDNRSMFSVLAFFVGILLTNDWLAYASFSLTFALILKASSVECAACNASNNARIA